MQSVEIINEANIFSYVLNFVFSVAFLGMLYKFLVTRKKDNAETMSISATANKTSLEVSDKLLKEWMTIANDATQKYQNAKDEIGGMRILLKEMVRFLKSNKIANSEELIISIEAALKD